ncbi:prominin-like protein [Drosophila subobscura]|uniref:prominin-like protein n=1 Tax=Drosophila subobscura TaxID=7241 RepID=UPI00155B3316|nr:prominin-like protein [Drosophila subobscura]
MSKYRKRNQRRRSLSAGGNISLALAALLLLFVLWLQLCAARKMRPKRAARAGPQIWREGYSGDGTTHEQLGQVHFPPVQFSKFEPVMNYTTREKSTRSLDGLLKFSRTFYDQIFPLDPSVPRGYLQFVGTDHMRMGPKVDKNDWAAWLSAYWMFWLWVIVLVALIILMPFLGVLYCCFCCCRCRQGCPPCMTVENRRRRHILGGCLALLIILIGLCMALAFYSNGLLERGLAKTKTTLEMGSVDTCNFLYSVEEHVNHLLKKNYEELSTHLVAMIMNAPQHIAADLNDASDANSLVELDRIFSNFEYISGVLESADYTDKMVRLTAMRLRDALRGVKRDVNFAATVLCGSMECIKFLGRTEIEYLDTSRCLHPEKMPEIYSILTSMKALIEHMHRPGEALEKLHEMTVLITEELERVAGPIIRDIQNGRKLFIAQADRINEIIDVVISDIHLYTLRTTRAFDDLYDRFNETRYYAVLYISVSVIVILTLLIFALLFGSFGKRVTGVEDGVFSQKIGSYFLLVAMVLIFCVVSIMLMMSLFYVVIGAVAYKGACAPLYAQKSAPAMPIDELRSESEDVDQERSGGAAPKLSNLIIECEGENMIFKYLRENRIYDVDDMVRMRVMSPMESNFALFEDVDLSNFTLVTEEDKEVYMSVSKQELGLIHPSLWYDHLCYDYVPIPFDNLALALKRMAKSLSWNNYRGARSAFENEYINLLTFYWAYAPALNRHISELITVVEDVDESILYQHYNFGDSLRILLKNILSTEIFIRDLGKTYLANIGKNLTAVINEQIDDYIKMVVYDANHEIGNCQPLSYIYDRSLDTICSEMVDPIIGYWLGIVLSAFLLMIVLCISHRLQCVYRQIHLKPYVPVKVTSTSCPFCMTRSQRLAAGGDCGCLPPSGTIIDVELALEATANHPKTNRDTTESSMDGKNKLD